MSKHLLYTSVAFGVVTHHYGEYPQEDVCGACGAHVGWIMVPEGELFRLGLCDDHLPDEEENDDEVPA